MNRKIVSSTLAASLSFSNRSFRTVAKTICRSLFTVFCLFAGTNLILLTVLLLSTPGSQAFSGDSRKKVANRPLLMTHYMPWFQTPGGHGYWGWHWTMNHYSPGVIDQSGHRQIASHFYPLTGPYDSKDAAILEYQTLLMKISGIDGALADWNGMESIYDYGVINESTRALFSAVQKAHLFFGIVYEDNSIKEMVNTGYLSTGTALNYGKSVMQYMQDNWFGSDTYVKLDNRPLLLTFGPQYFFQSSDWDTMFSGLSTKPVFVTLDNQLAPVASGAYPWPPMWSSDASGILSQAAVDSYLAQFYLKATSWPYLVASAFPGFHDIYQQAGVGSTLGYLDRLDGSTFRSTLQQALSQNPDVIQLVTWNDYGEGTTIEPTAEYGYQYLEIVQAIRESLDPFFIFLKEDLTLPLRMYDARLRSGGLASINSVLDRVFTLVVSEQRDAAVALLDSLLSNIAILSVNTQAIEFGAIDVNVSHRDTTFTVTNLGDASDSVYITLDYVNVAPESSVTVSPTAFALPAGSSQTVTFSLRPRLMAPTGNYNTVVMMDSRFGFGKPHFEKTMVFEIKGTLSAQDGSQQLPAEFALHQNFPNPWNPSTTIRYELPKATHVLLTVYDALGREVATLVQGDQEAGYHEVRFDGLGLASGVYLYRLTAGEFVQTRRLLLLK